MVLVSTPSLPYNSVPYSIQYRMHPAISRLPSRVFYESKLKDGEGMAELRKKPWHVSPLFKPYQFFDVADGREEKADAGYSLKNVAEVRLTVLLYGLLRSQFSGQFDFDNSVGIIAMYDAQKKQLQREFLTKFGADVANRISFGTVDGFQGQEKDIIFVSAVRGGPSVSRIGHVSDIRRMNVAITRARSSLFILGHAATLERSDAKWKGVIDDARERQLLTTVRHSVSSSCTHLETSHTIDRTIENWRHFACIANSSRDPSSQTLSFEGPSQTCTSTHSDILSRLSCTAKGIAGTYGSRATWYNIFDERGSHQRLEANHNRSQRRPPSCQTRSGVFHIKAG